MNSSDILDAYLYGVQYGQLLAEGERGEEWLESKQKCYREFRKLLSAVFSGERRSSAMLFTDFSAGVLDPMLFGRVDLPQYYKGAAVLDNFTVVPTGDIHQRNGVRRVNTLTYTFEKAFSFKVPFDDAVFLACIKADGTIAVNYLDYTGEELREAPVQYGDTPPSAYRRRSSYSIPSARCWSTGTPRRLK
ncbi:hypothetical protein [Treponema endosymbiont of Eucomonympha sp.]|uniref:hypothetical protein n=1 Tax=Treponema endosymbiont of Eucomonympha sp. TaxID=1580831 RepID=UPI0007508F16|nr:hypothetical protein [Treponema endosymbiont of Eucomonympha sp.]